MRSERISDTTNFAIVLGEMLRRLEQCEQRIAELERSNVKS